MKTSQIARGIVGALSLAGVIGAVGCGAQGYEEGVAGEGEIGSVEQAIGIAVTEQNAFNYGVAFMGFAPITGTTDQELIAGGYTSDTGTVTANIRKVLYTDAAPDTADFTSVTGLNTARAELKLAAIPGHSGFYLAVGGQTSSAGNVLLNTAEVINLNTNPVTVTAVTDTLSSVRSRFGLTVCGDKLLTVAGESRSGGGVANVSGALEVFTFDPNGDGNPVDSTFDPMVNADDHSTVVTMSTARKFITALTLPAIVGGTANRILIPAGETAAAVLGSSEILDVNAACEFVDNDGNVNVKKAVPHTGPSLPSSAVLTKYGAMAKSITFTPSGGSSTVFEAIIGAGQGTSATSLKTYLYNDNANPASATWTVANDLLSAHVLPIAIDESSGTTGVGFSGGYAAIVTSLNILNPTGGVLTTAEYDFVATSNGATSNPADMTEPVVGHWGAFLDSLPVVSHGIKWTAGPTSAFPQVTN